MPGEQPDDVADADHRVAGAQEDDRPLGVAEALHVHQVRGHCHEGRHTAERRPQRDPELGEAAFVAAEVGSVTRHGAVRHTARPYPVVVRTRRVGDGDKWVSAIAATVALC